VTYVRVEGLDEVVRKMERLANGKIVTDTLTAYALKVEEDVKPYPPESEANRPPEPYYQRLVGTVTNNGIRRTSQQMRDKWYVKSDKREVSLNNRATYSGFVQGLNQARFHGQRGWKIAHRRAEQMLGKLEDIFRFEFEKQWRKG